jgi:hypothetical protein
MTIPHRTVLLAAALALFTTAPAHADDAPTGPAFLKGLANLVKLHDLGDMDAVSRALGLDFVVDTKIPGGFDVEAKPDWLTRASYVRRTFPPRISGVSVSLQLAPSAGCVRTEQVAAWLGHDYQLTPFYTRTELGGGKVDALLQYVLSYKYPGNPSLKISFQPDHYASNCFRFISADSSLPK